MNHFDNCTTAAENIIARIGKKIVLGVPLGLGKPIGLLNAFYRLACADPSIQLTIFTGLTLARPALKNELEKRLVKPILDRLLNDFEDPLYEKARETQQLPSNINVIEFFLSPGKFLHNKYVQQNYISSVYTDVVRDVTNQGINVLAQQVARSAVQPDLYSLSSNSDLFHETAQFLRVSGKNFAIAAEINLNLPFMHGDAIVSADTFTDIIDTQQYRSLFAMPREEVTPHDHMIGLYTSCLIKDDGCLQLGIGKLSNATANALILRHQNNKLYHHILDEMKAKEKFSRELSAIGELSSFTTGLYASTEMMSDEYMQLYKAGIIKKHVYDHIGLQQLLNSKKITETITPHFLGILLEHNLIQTQLTAADVKFLLEFGILKSITAYQDGCLILTSGEKISANLSSEQAKQALIKKCLGNKLKNGKLIHAAFFIGSNDFYQQLRALTPDELERINMTAVARTNSLYWSFELAKLQRENARFVNSAMMVTLGGEVISDGLQNLQEVSGVGGQFDFVTMGAALPDARSIINLHSVRETKKGLQSNILWNYSNITVPRFFRDIVVTEYGIADCRSKTDAEIIKAILNITDSRFQDKLLKTAKKYGKIARDYEIPDEFRNNHYENLLAIVKELQAKGYAQPYPFGSDLTDDEIVIGRALLSLKNLAWYKLLLVICRAMFCFTCDETVKRYLLRMDLLQPKNLREWVYKKILAWVVLTLSYLMMK